MSDNQTLYGADLNGGPRWRFGGFAVTVPAETVLEITNLVPTRAQLDPFWPFLAMTASYRIGAGSNGEGVYAILTDDPAVLSVYVRPNIVNLIGNIRIDELWPYDPDPSVDALRAPDPPDVGAIVPPAPPAVAPNRNYLFLENLNDEDVIVYICFEAPTGQVWQSFSRLQYVALNHYFGGRYIEKAQVFDLAPEAIVELTPNVPARAEIQGRGWLELLVNYDVEQAGNLVWAAFTDQTGAADPENRIAYAPLLLGPNWHSTRISLTPFPILGIASIYPRIEQDSETLEDGTRLFLVNTDTAITYEISLVWRVTTLNFN